MKPAFYLVLALGLVSAQTSLLPHLDVFGVRPDLCLVAACLIGFLNGELEGLLMGMALGLGQDLFSAGGWGGNLAAKGAAGLGAGLLAGQMTHPTTRAVGLAVLGLSLCASALFLLALRMGKGIAVPLVTVGSVAVPQALMDAALGAGLYWFLMIRRRDCPGAREDGLRLGV
jgi:hypothetical protein